MNAEEWFSGFHSRAIHSSASIRFYSSGVFKKFRQELPPPKRWGDTGLRAVQNYSARPVSLVGVGSEEATVAQPIRATCSPFGVWTIVGADSKIMGGPGV